MKGLALAAKVAKEKGALYIEQMPDWTGKECYVMYFYDPSEEAPQIGYPQYILTDGKRYTITDPMKSLMYIKYLNDKYGFNREGMPNGFESNGPIRIANKNVAMDGGPGSGNFGHKGRPGKVGGSQKGGGTQYRGGRSDIGYFGSRKDWLNGLSGESQHEAVRQIAEAKKKMQEARTKTENLEKVWKQGLITKGEYDDKLKDLGLEVFDKNDSPEAFILKFGDNVEKTKLLDKMSEARNWNKNKERLIDENLSDEDKKLLSYTSEHLIDDDGIARREKLNVQKALLGKAMGVEVEPKASEDLLYASGAREKRGIYPKTAEENNVYINNLSDETKKEIVDLMTSLGHDPYRANWSGDVTDTPNMNEAERDMLGDTNIPHLERNKYLEVKDRAFGGNYFKSIANYKDGETLGCLREEASKKMHDNMSKMVEIYKGDREDATIENFGKEAEKAFLSDRNITGYDKAQYLYAKAVMLGTTFKYSKDTSFVNQIELTLASRENEIKEEKKIKKDLEAFKKNKEEREKQYVSAKDAEEIGRIMKSSGMFKNGSSNIDISKMDRSNAVETARRYDQFAEKFPFMFGNLGSLKCIPKSGDVYGTCYMYTGSVELNSKWYDSFYRFERSFSEDVSSGYHPKGLDSSSVVTHELAHALDGYLSNKGINGSKNYGTDTKQFSGILRRSVLKKLKMTKASIRMEVSKYAEKNAHEWFAECMSEAICSKDPRPMAKECMRQTMEILKGEGLLDA